MSKTGGIGGNLISRICDDLTRFRPQIISPVRKFLRRIAVWDAILKGRSAAEITQLQVVCRYRRNTCRDEEDRQKWKRAGFWLVHAGHNRVRRDNRDSDSASRDSA